ncbi:MAG TPA: hypothetical protein PK864_07555 [Syntrophorhabdaceae bacterium]|nr:hypothetical protein [Syntrophorhabdaceae bacterium]HOL06344.1 hypothetical protein [Syntrophorhabdaceae bacterium]HON85870.1 hypothetical protein [Syntrophorhabdaceae bacterium]HOT41785.1 hypothetical protein [Syntrophorhabdaceae bacterium]HPC67275.1 hypothetical protein [Syntrophorhabdaceae bacterium]
MMKTQFITDKGGNDNEMMDELLSMTIERLPQYKWLINNKERHDKKGDFKIRD